MEEILESKWREEEVKDLRTGNRKEKQQYKQYRGQRKQQYKQYRGRKQL